MHRNGGVFVGIILHSLLSAVAYLHQPNLRLIHRDITPSNILVRKIPNSNPKSKFDYCFKLSDFGLARQHPPVGEDPSMTQNIGTMPYRAPEILLTGHYNTSVDLWSIGCCLAEIISGEILFRAKTPEKLLLKIVEKVSLRDDQIMRLPKFVRSFGNRINFYQSQIDLLFPAMAPVPWTQSHIGMREFNFFIHRMLEFDPNLRVTAEKALNLDFWNFLKRCRFYDPENPPPVENEFHAEIDVQNDGFYRG